MLTAGMGISYIPKGIPMVKEFKLNIKMSLIDKRGKEFIK